MVEALRSALPQHLQRQLNSARELARQREATPTSLLATSVAGLDNLLVGGLPRGQMVELVGHRSSGRFSTVLSVIAAATAAGEAAALVDLGDGLDPELAAAAGAALERLLWVRPHHLKQALISAEMLLASGFPLVAVELGCPPVPGGRGAEAAWLRLARAAHGHAAVLLVSSPYRVSGTAAAGVVRTERGQALWSGSGRSAHLLLGLSARLTLEKLRGRQGSKSEPLRLVLPEAAAFGPMTAQSQLPAAGTSAEPSITLIPTRSGIDTPRPRRTHCRRQQNGAPSGLLFRPALSARRSAAL